MPSASHRPALGSWSILALAILVGAALGVLDASHWLVREMSPSVARRVGSAALYAAALSAGVALVAAALVELLVAVGRRRGWRPGAGSGHGLRWIGWSFVTVLSILLLAAERRVSAADLGTRWSALALCVVAALAVAAGAALITGRLRRDRLDAVTRRVARPRWWLGISIAAAGIATLRVLSAVPGESEGPRRGAATAPRPPNIVLVVADTLRADALGCYGNPDADTPVLDGLAERGVTFERVVAPSSWTLPSVVSILTSTYPHEHGFVDFVDTVGEELVYLPEILARHGYRTLASVGNVTMAEWRGFARGFDFFDVYGYLPESRLVASRLVSGALLLSGLGSTSEPGRRPLLWPQAEPPFLRVRWSYYTYDRETNRPLVERLEEGLEEPFFLYVHYLAPHEPYLTHTTPLLDSMPALAPRNLEVLEARYRAEVGYLDGALGELLAVLERAGHRERTVVAFTSDHGEAFLEHDRFGHGKDLYQEVLAVPLILAGPGIPAGVRWPERVSLIDLAPTLLAAAGIEPTDAFRGESLLPILAGSEARDSRPILAETSSRMLTPQHRFDATLDGRWKLIRIEDREDGAVRLELYDLERDPLEQNPLPADDAPAELRSLLERLSRPAPEVDEEDLSERELEVLRALGYVN